MLAMFSKGNYKDGLRAKCKECENKNKKKYRNNNKEDIARKNKIYGASHREEQKQYRNNNRSTIALNSKEYRNNNKEHISKIGKRWRKDNKEMLREYDIRYTNINKENIAKKRIIFYKNNKELMNNRRRIYVFNNKEKVNILTQKYIAKKKQLPHTLTFIQWNNIKNDFNHECAYCGQEKPLAQEHFIALSKGGEYTTNNIIPSCKSCNSSKGNRDFKKWYMKQEYYSKIRETKILNYLHYDGDIQQLRIT